MCGSSSPGQFTISNISQLEQESLSFPSPRPPAISFLTVRPSWDRFLNCLSLAMCVCVCVCVCVREKAHQCVWACRVSACIVDVVPVWVCWRYLVSRRSHRTHNTHSELPGRRCIGRRAAGRRSTLNT